MLKTQEKTIYLGVEQEMLAKRLSFIKPSPTLAMSAKAAQMKARGIDIINLSAGEPDFDTPDFIKQAATAAMAKGMTKYTAVDGMPALKKAIQQKFLRDNQLSYEPEQLMVSTGGKQVIFNALMATIEQGDEVIIPAPYWVSYPDMTALFGGKPVFVECIEANGFKLTPSQLDEVITPKTKWLILNSPSNPTGELYSKEELMALGEVLLKHPHVYVMSDDIYEYLVYDEKPFYTIASLVPGLRSRILVVNGVSKSYSMTGWRIGYGAGPKELIKAMTMLQSQSTSNACSIAQAATIDALSSDLGFLKAWKTEFAARRDFFHAEINKIEGLSARKASGAFYLYINCSGIIGKITPQGSTIESDNDFTTYLLEHANIAAVSGAAFGLSPYFRISYATSKEILSQAIRRIAAAVAELT
ncbi:pyridoxal phosphate-dependent aminotransferase [Candidatus Paracaedibacter symbiosus]|uniref:pyridoxal phosphate-dependent aminotransferase n=1 Tax=Candidatus Paracaedibacter symbiosus TaxID=244582 RepID=UPI000AB0EAB9|nr:pyridoxal phosphate-dependent aminotransferase [Candidatus Paracaedibacter symbiosus]